MKVESQARTPRAGRPAGARRLGSALGALAVGALCLVSPGAAPVSQGEVTTDATRTLEETRLALGKWIETQQIISKERSDWQRGREVLTSRLELVRQEVTTLEQSIAEAQARVAEAEQKRAELLAESGLREAAGAQLTTAVTEMERAVRELLGSLPDPLQTKLQPLYQRIPRDPSEARVSVAERFQNVLGILNELNKANNEITVSYEVHTLAGGRPSEVQAIYVGLAQAYYVSAGGEAGIGRPTPEGWRWEPSPAVARDVLMALEILQGKHTPAFVPLPVKVQ